MKTFISALALIVAVLSSHAASAQTARTVTEGYEDNIKGAQAIGALGPDMFGEQVNLADGATEFRASDVSVTTNSGLPVSVGRVLGISARDSDMYTDFARDGELFGNWRLDVPMMHGVFDARVGWTSSKPVGTQRCSTASNGEAAPPGAWGTNWPSVAYPAERYWAGNRINIPGRGEEAWLALPAGRPRPNDGRTYYGTTKSEWRVACVPSLQNGTGEGFLVVLPDGTQYRFDWMSTRRVASIKDTVCNVHYGCPSGINLDRNEVFLHATHVEDRFGNFVDYRYDPANPRRLLSITSSDGAAISFTYVGGKVDTVTSGSRVWRYEYADAQRTTLSGVLLPDGSRWSYGYQDVYTVTRSDSRVLWRDCAADAGARRSDVAPTGGGSVTITHPSGAVGTFRFRKLIHGSNNTPGICYDPDIDRMGDEQVSDTPMAWEVPSLYEKSVSGPGLTTGTWSHYYQPSWSWSMECPQPGMCATTSQTRVTAPNGVVTRYTFGNDYQTNLGQLLQVNIEDGGTVVQSTSNGYLADPQGQPFPAKVGYDPNTRNNKVVTEDIRPQNTTTIVRDGVSFNSRTNTFDSFARPLVVEKWSSLGYGKTDVSEYYDDLSKWVLGQTKRQVNANANVVTAQTDYDPATALPLRTYSFGKLQNTLGYYADGTLRTVTDGRNETILLSNWKRGIPQRIQHPDGTGESAVVNDSGWVTAVADENEFWTGYGYDAMGRMASIVYPTGDSTVWNTRYSDFRALTAADWMPSGISPGQWRQQNWQGGYRKIVYFDSMWRPVLEHEYDEGNVASTLRSTSRTYDASGRVSFQSYPSSALIPPSTGSRTSYDPLNRVTQVKQDSELGELTSTTQYLTGFQVRTTNPRGLSSTTAFTAYDQPTTDWPRFVVHPEGAYTDIVRDIFSRPTAVTRRNIDASQSVIRRYVYDGGDLCKTIEPETGSTVMAYDAANNLEWSAAGLNLPSLSCDHGAAFASGRAVQRDYNSRNRLIGLRFPDGRGNQTWTYTPDGLPERIITSNDGPGQTTVENHYQYNKRRMLIRERSVQPGWYDWPIAYGYDANGNLASQNYPTNLNVDYAPNALGQPTRAGSWAINVSYYPNGAIQQFTYGNGLTHTMTQNARQLPVRVTDGGGALDFEYAFDTNGNVSQISDHALGSYTSRWMNYDGLDRLTAAGSCSFGGDCWHRYTYDALDNMTSSKLAGVKEHNYEYDAATKRLSMVRNNAGAATTALEYDVQGNLRVKNGQSYSFDFGNRLRDVTGKEYYRYDGHGRRVLAWDPNQGSILSQYSQSGQVMYQHDDRKTTASEHIYLGGSLLATREYNWALGQVKTKYQHTDALGSPVAVTNEAGQVIDRTQYEPYGATIGKVAYGIGYTGHVSDAATGLTYMQQRYYDPTLGRFLSVDPIAANSNTGAGFNRYWYAANNPYKFTDPDGRCEKARGSHICRGGGGSVGTGTRSAGPVGDVSASGGATRSRNQRQQPQNPVGTIANANGIVADAGSIAANSGAGSLAKFGHQAGEDAAMWKGISRSLGRLGSIVGFAAGGVEVAQGVQQKDGASIGHGAAALTVGGLAAAGVIAPPAALAIGIADFGVSFVDYKSNAGETSSGWSAILNAGADGIENNAKRDAQNGPLIY